MSKAKSKTKAKNTEKRPAPNLSRHVKALELAGVDEYRAWCQRQGLGGGVHKSSRQQKKEAAFSRRLKGERAMALSKRQARHPGQLVADICRGQVKRNDLKTEFLRQLFDGAARLEDEGSRQALVDLVHHVQAHSKLARKEGVMRKVDKRTGVPIVEGLAALTNQRPDWVRPLEEWKPTSHNVLRQFGELARHLLAQYPVPGFMDAAFFQRDAKKAAQHQYWFKYIGTGGNIRKAEHMPLQLTKKMAHLFLQARDSLSIEGALRWAQVRSQGGSEVLARAIMDTRLGESFQEEPFWSQVILYLINNPMLDPDCVGPLIDYIHNQRFVPQEQELPNGLIECGEPPQPDFSLKGRSVTKLVAQMEEWHGQLAKEDRRPFYAWPKSAFGEYRLVENGKRKEDKINWRVHELTNTRELAAEGTAMHHCVASYARNCRRGNVSIWSLQAERIDGRTRPVLTIAVDNHNSNVTQVRGKYNATFGSVKVGKKHPEINRAYLELLRASRRVLKGWMAQEGLGGMGQA